MGAKRNRGEKKKRKRKWEKQTEIPDTAIGLLHKVAPSALHN